MDREEEAFRRLALRVSRVRGGLAGICVLGGVAAGALLYLWVQDVLLEHFYAHIPYLTMMVTIVPCMLAGFFAGRAAGRAVTRVRISAWAVSIAKELGVPEARLLDAAKIWD